MPHEQSGPGRSSSRGVGSGTCPHSPPIAFTPSTMPPVDDDAAADTGPEDDAEDHLRAFAGAVHRLGKREAVGVVGDLHRPAQCCREVAAQVAAVQPGRVALGDDAGCAIDRARHADADAFDPPAGRALQLVEQTADRPDAAVVVVARRRHPRPRPLGAVGAENDALDLGAAVVEPQPHRSPPDFPASIAERSRPRNRRGEAVEGASDLSGLDSARGDCGRPCGAWGAPTPRR